MFLSVIVLPLVSSILVGYFGRVIGHIGSFLIANLCLLVTCFFSLVIFYEVNLSSIKILIELFEWFNIGLVQIKCNFFFDAITAVMLLVVTSISSLVHLYSISYMKQDPHFVRFMSYLSLFTFFMILLITSSNCIQLFLGWEGVGISSYLLINFWFTRVAANQSAIKAVFVNRFGDIGILLAIFSIFMLSESLDFFIFFSEINNLKNDIFIIANMNIHAISLISFALFIGAVGKSAQLGLHTWLPDAMEGPTPVSALIHAATMVTAGVFVLIRMSFILEYSLYVLAIISLVGALTAFFAGTIGIFQNDLKRVIAYSTCSQLGYMVVGCGLSSYSITLFHLMNHAFFKALLFLSAGAVIHAVFDEQDMRKLGGLVHILPYTFIMFIIGSLSLMGFPFTTGYYSKDVLLELAISGYYISNVYIYWLLFLGAGCTAFYSFRLLYLTFLSEIRISKVKINYIEDASLIMSIVMFILVLGSIFIGYICKDMFLGLGSTFFGNSIGFNFVNKNILLLEAEYLTVKTKLAPVVFSILIATITYIFYRFYYTFFYIKFENQYLIYNFFNKKWYFDEIYNKIFVNFVFNFSYLITFKLLDRGLFEIIGPTGMIRFFNFNKNFFLEHNSGYIFKGIFIMLIGLIFYSCLSFNLIFFLQTVGIMICLVGVCTINTNYGVLVELIEGKK